MNLTGVCTFLQKDGEQNSPCSDDEPSYGNTLINTVIRRDSLELDQSHDQEISQSADAELDQSGEGEFNQSGDFYSQSVDDNVDRANQTDEDYDFNQSGEYYDESFEKQANNYDTSFSRDSLRKDGQLRVRFEDEFQPHSESPSVLEDNQLAGWIYIWL